MEYIPSSVAINQFTLRFTFLHSMFCSTSSLSTTVTKIILLTKCVLRTSTKGSLSVASANTIRHEEESKAFLDQLAKSDTDKAT